MAEGDQTTAICVDRGKREDVIVVISNPLSGLSTFKGTKNCRWCRHVSVSHRFRVFSVPTLARRLHLGSIANSTPTPGVVVCSSCMVLISCAFGTSQIVRVLFRDKHTRCVLSGRNRAHLSSLPTLKVAESVAVVACHT